MRKDRLGYTKREKEYTIKFYAEHYHSPISDFKGFNQTLYDSTGIRTTKAHVAYLLGYTTKNKG